MFAKLGGATIFSTIDLRSAYYHIGLTRESQAKSAFRRPNGEMAVQKDPVWTQSSPSIFSITHRPGTYGMWRFRDGLPG